MPYSPTQIPFNVPKAPPLPQTQGTPKNAVSPNYHDINAFYHSPSGKDPSLLPIYQALQKMNVNLVVDGNDMMRSDAGLKPGEFNNLQPGGFHDTGRNMIVLNGDQQKYWWRNVPHEYAHQVVEHNNLQQQQNKLFKDQEDMADSYVNYYNDPTRYTTNFSPQAQWFKSNFITSATPIPSPVITGKKTTVAKKML